MRSRPASPVSPSVTQLRVARPTRRDLDTPVLDNYRALVLDGAFRPLGIVNWHRAVTLDVFKAVEVLEYYDCFVKTVREDYPVPAVLRTEFVMKGFGRSQITLNRKNVMKRDRNACVYCGVGHDLTIDHLVPLSHGGEDSWENLVTACKGCNNRKANRSLAQMGWKLKTVPKKPARFDMHFTIDLPLHSPKEWHHYIAHLRQPGSKFV